MRCETGRVEGWFVQATNRSPTSANGVHLLIAALRSFYTVMQRGAFDPRDQRYHPLYAFDNPMYSKVLVAWRSEHRNGSAMLERRTMLASGLNRVPTRLANRDPTRSHRGHDGRCQSGSAGDRA